MTRQIMIGALLLALLAGTASVPGATQSPADSSGSTEKPAAKTPAANVQILPASLALAATRDGVIRVPVVAINQGAERARFWFRPVMFDANGQPIALDVTGMWRSKTEDWIEPGEVVPFNVTLRATQPAFDPWWDGRLPLKGHLAIESTTESGPAVKTRKVDLRELNVPQMQPATLEVGAVLGTAGISVVLLLVALQFGSKTAPAGSASWSSDSIGANVALGAGLVSGLFAVAGLPQLTIYASRPTYGVLIAIFTAVVALASPAANLLSKVFSGLVGLFAAATLVLWGALGQFVVAFFLVLELYRASVLANLTALTLAALDVVLAAGVIAYVVHAVAQPQTRAPARSMQPANAPPTPAVQEWAIP